MTNDNMKGKSLEGNALFPDRPDSLILILLPFLLFRYHYYFSPFLLLQRQHPATVSLCTSIMTVICHSQLWNSSAGVNLTTSAISSFHFFWTDTKIEPGSFQEVIQQVGYSVALMGKRYMQRHFPCFNAFIFNFLNVLSGSGYKIEQSKSIE